MTKLERVLATMEQQPTDRVPVYDLLQNDAVIGYFTGAPAPYGEKGFEAACKTISACMDMTRAINGPSEDAMVEDEVGFIHKIERWQSWLAKRPFDDVDGAANWVESRIRYFRHPDRVAEARDAVIDYHHRARHYLGDDTVVLLRESGVGLDFIRNYLDWELFTYVSVDQPEVISGYMDAYTDLEVAIIHEIGDLNLSPCALTYGDIAYKNALLHSPAWLRQEFFPRLRKINDAYHEHGIKCLFHSDGYLMDVMPDLIESGIDGLNPIETLAGMSVSEVKRLYGDKIFLTGGIDVSELLCYGTVQETERVCREAIEDGSPGYFIGSTTELHWGAKLENVLAMFRVAGSIQNE